MIVHPRRNESKSATNAKSMPFFRYSLNDISIATNASEDKEMETSYSNCIVLLLYLNFDKHGGCVDVGIVEMWLCVE